eukprot:CAMPEP_0172920944 /NCGR_PEP_ID=MMETSP1075-20121228/205021_1 /TAXON_ID=2916 /ORGANISM="Ceratium fusus, Strain PA161109" /LENGTH=86 /DNA_ID=CAMNT_0013781043 /DNA_START=2 /DNA_END=259 /DNA_ORIENTATION=-
MTACPSNQPLAAPLPTDHDHPQKPSTAQTASTEASSLHADADASGRAIGHVGSWNHVVAAQPCVMPGTLTAANTADHVQTSQALLP